MFTKNPDSIKRKEENDRVISLEHKLKLQEEKIKLAVESNTSFITISSLESGYRQIAKELNTLYARLGVNRQVPEDYTTEQERANKNFAYRDRKQETSIGEDKDQDTLSFDPEDQSLLGALAQVTPIAAPNKRNKFELISLNLENLNLDQTADEKAIISSTPIVGKSKTAKDGQFTDPNICLEHVKRELPNELPPGYIESFLEDKKNQTELLELVKRGFNLPNIYQIIKEKILGFVNPKEEELSNLTGDGTPLLSALEFLPEDNTVKTMSNTLDMRGLSVKDALDLIPRYNGANIPLTQFLDGCAEAKSILPDGVEPNFMKFVRIRLYGEALNIARSQSFSTLKELAEFFEKMFGSAKTFYDLTGELAKIKQGRNETVVYYLNRLKVLETEIKKAAQKEGRITNETVFDNDLSKDCLKYFMRGLRWEIKARMGKPDSYQNAQEEAIETEREYACSEFNDPTEKEKGEEKSKFPREVRRVNIVEPERVNFTCWYCNKPGHTLARCFALERKRQAWRPQGNFDRPRNSMFPQPQRNDNAWGWNAGNNRQVGFLPEQNNRARGFSPPPNVRGMRPALNPPRTFDGPLPSHNTNTGTGGFSRGRGGNTSTAGRGNLDARNPTAMNCYYCGRTGHMQRDCYSYQRAVAQTQVRSGNATGPSPTGAERETSSLTRPPMPPRENVPRPSMTATS